MQIQDPCYRERVAAIIDDADFIQLLGLELADTGPGWCATRLPLERRHRQQDGFVHAGVLATVADHTAGCAAFTLLPPDQIVLTVEFKLNLLSPATGEWLRGYGEVLRPGRSLIVAESWLRVGEGEGDGKLCAKATATLAKVAKPD